MIDVRDLVARPYDGRDVGVQGVTLRYRPGWQSRRAEVPSVGSGSCSGR